MSYTESLQDRLKQLKEADAKLPALLTKVARDATLRAIEAAADATPPNNDTELKGTNTITGELKAHWAIDSVVAPEKAGLDYMTQLRNDVQYASYVNDGHRMDRHFVPGLYINETSGLLEYDPAAKVGIVVGTKTKYVKGLHMTDKGKQAYQEAVLAELDKDIRRLMG